MLNVFTSNRLEILAEGLGRKLAKPLKSALDQEIIVVQSRGMERWLCLRLARAHGIWANFRFPFPNAFIHELFQAFIPDLTASTPFDPKTLTWRIMQKLPDLVRQPGFEPLQSYFAEEADDLKRLQLAGRIADTFDQYLVFRPEMVMGWDQGKEEHWQARLWRELARGQENKHRAALARLFLKKLEAGGSEAMAVLPERVTVFGISALPKFHLQILAGLARHIEINLFLMNPCREYWGDILSDWEIKRKLAKSRAGMETREPPALHFEKGNSLLVSMGQMGRDFFEQIHELEFEESSLFRDADETTLLGCLQADILNLRERSGAAQVKKRIAIDDRSIGIHACHGPRREMEVLRDQLLYFFETIPGLTPRDILVMAPDIHVYTPYIQAVFDVPQDDGRWIPFSIADQSLRSEGRIIEPFLAILNLCRSRFGAAQVLSLLESQAVQKRFGLNETSLARIKHWVGETRIRWGRDGQDREKAGLPGLSENSWSAGMERLLLGYAMPGREQRLFQGILPYDAVEGDETETLGLFCEFAHCLFTQARDLEEPRRLDQWAQTFNGLLDAFFAPETNGEAEMQMIRKALADLAAMAAGDTPLFKAAIELKPVQWHLEQLFGRESFGHGFITGGVTFCTMLPMRSIPFRVIALLGLNHDAYPRQSKPPSFDLIARHPRPGDRSRRQDDRYLFLESLLSARDVFYVSYLGRDIQDNSLLPPSVLVHELLDVIEGGFECSEQPIREHILNQHRLQAFHQDYFKPGGRLFSYSLENLEIARQSPMEQKKRSAFISTGLSEPDDAFQSIEPAEFVRFFSHPSRYLLNRRLGLYLDERTGVFEEEELFALQGLDRYQLAGGLLARRLRDGEFRQGPDLARAAGQLPHGEPGQCQYEKLEEELEAFAQRIERFCEGEASAALDLERELSGILIRGRLPGIYRRGLLRYRFAGLKATDLIKAWIEHLLLNACGPGDYPRETALFGLEKKEGEWVWSGVSFLPVEQSTEILAFLAQVYQQGLQKPLAFFPETSLTFAAALLEKGLETEEALQRAYQEWEGSDFHPGLGEGHDPYHERCFGHADPLDKTFQDLAVKIYEPLLEHKEKMPEVDG